MWPLLTPFELPLMGRAGSNEGEVTEGPKGAALAWRANLWEEVTLLSSSGLTCSWI
jgi:hypothetical protein